MSHWSHIYMDIPILLKQVGRARIDSVEARDADRLVALA